MKIFLSALETNKSVVHKILKLTKLRYSLVSYFYVRKNPEAFKLILDNSEDNLDCDQMVTDMGDFASMCEHHALPFMGQYFFAYIPNPKGKILGLSKIARVVDYCAARLQIQERLVHDVVDMIEQALGTENPPLGVACVMKAHHTCKEIRGAKKKGIMSNSCLHGLFLTDAAVRSEFMNLVNNTKIE